MKFNLLKNKEKSHKNTANSNSAINERTREKFILKEWVESSRKPTCTNERTQGFLFGSQPPFKRNFSLGRSMVEMLGVLAIIGVLSIGGIQGYTIAMRRHRTNEILNELQKYALNFYTSAHQKLLNDEVYVSDREYDNGFWIDKSNWGNHLSGGGDVNGIPHLGIDQMNIPGIKSTASGDFVLFQIHVYDKSICEMLVNTTGDVIEDSSGYASQCMQSDGGSSLRKTTYYLYLSFLMS